MATMACGSCMATSTAIGAQGDAELGGECLLEGPEAPRGEGRLASVEVDGAAGDAALEEAAAAPASRASAARAHGAARASRGIWRRGAAKPS